MLIKPDERQKANTALHGLLKDLMAMSDQQLIGLIQAGKAQVSAVCKLAGQEATFTFSIQGPQKLPEPPPQGSPK